MGNAKCFEDYPFYLVFICNLLSISIYLISLYIIGRVGIIWMIIYLIFILSSEYRLLKHSCINCCYYGKYCAFGRGKVCSLLFKRGDPKTFINMKITWKSFAPDFLMFIVPLIIGIVLLVIRFEWLLLSSLAALFLLGFFGNALIRGRIACRYCKQRKIGCPAEKFFNKNNR